MNTQNPNETRLCSIDELEQNILSLARQINVATYELLVMVREFDERAGFLQWGLSNAAEWLAWRCDISATTAYEKVRVAHALKHLRSVSAAFAAGELSYAKVRALTRVASRENESDLLEFALRHTAANVEQYCRELRNGNPESVSTAERAIRNRSLRIRRDAERGMMAITIEVPIESGEIIEKALDKARDDDVLQVADVVDTSWQTRQADAVVAMAREYLAGMGSDASSDTHLVTIHVDQSALSGGEGRSGLPIESVKRLCCDNPVVVLTENDKGEPLTIGRKSRIIPTAIARAVNAQYGGGCGFPGCSNHRFIHLHHIEHWSSGGETSVENLMPLCTRHHQLVHEGGFRIDKDYQDNWMFLRPDGIAVPECGHVTRGASDLIEYSSAEESALNPENFAGEQPSPVYLH
ncbi:MAG: DUF222 domain-containing protein [Pseudomonadota bacterium]